MTFGALVNLDLINDVVARLRQGAGLDRLGLSRVDGRWDLRGLVVPSPTVAGRSTVRLVGGGEHEIERVTGVTKFARLDLVDVDLRRAKLGSVVFEDCVVRNCLFDEAGLDDARFFACSVSDSSFRAASLRGALLGGAARSRPPSFDRVDFSRSRLNDADPGSAVFTECTFDATRLKGVEFWGARLIRCRFAGKVDNVIFAGRRSTLGLFGHDETLIDVDFSQATFQWVEFRNLNLDRVTLPTGPGHIVVRRPRCVLQRLLGELRTDPHPDADRRALIAVLELNLKRLGPHQTQAVFTVGDIVKSDDFRGRASAMILAASNACNAA